MVDREASQQRTRAIFGELADADDVHREALLEELVELHTPLVVHIARRFADRGEPVEDLVQVGMLALVGAVDRFDPERRAEFSTFLTPTVLGEIKRHFRDHGWSVKVPRRAQELHALVSVTARDFAQEFGRSPSIADLMAATGLSESDVLTALEAGHAYNAVSIDAPAGESGLTVADRLEDPIDDLDGLEWRTALSALIAELPPREQLILRMRFNEEMAQSQIAERLGVSQMHVSRLLKRAVDQLRTGLVPPA